MYEQHGRIGCAFFWATPQEGSVLLLSSLKQPKNGLPILEETFAHLQDKLGPPVERVEEVGTRCLFYSLF